jgi:capsular exopolysaccharide synthesis family protein
VELVDYLHIVRRRMVLILVITLACVAGAGVATALQTTTYRASVRLIVSGASSVSDVDEIARRQLAVQRAVAFSQIASTPPAVSAALKVADDSGPYSSCASPSVSSSADGTDPFLTISVTDCDPRQAAAVANAYVTVLPGVLKSLKQVTVEVPAEISSLGPAAVPTSPYSPRLWRNLLIGLVIGLALGGVAAFVREGLDRRLRDSDEVEGATGAAILGVVPTELEGVRTPVLTHPMSARAEAYRKVRTNLMFAGSGGMPASLLITSAVSGEGKTTVATNLALACARTGQRVVIVDADLRRPMVSSYLGVAQPLGLTSVVAGEATLAEALTPVDDGRVHVLGSGPIPSNPSELLGSAQMGSLLDELRDTFDIVIVDAPPVLPVADALVLAGELEAVVIVTRVGDTTRERLKQAADAVLQVKGNLVGIVPNAVVQREDSAYAYAYRYRSRKGPGPPMLTTQARAPEIEVTVLGTPETAEVQVFDEELVEAEVVEEERVEPEAEAPEVEQLALVERETVQRDPKQAEIAARIQAAFAAASDLDQPRP